jgi:hypothetical protein
MESLTQSYGHGDDDSVPSPGRRNILREMTTPLLLGEERTLLR